MDSILLCIILIGIGIIFLYLRWKYPQKKQGILALKFKAVAAGIIFIIIGALAIINFLKIISLEPWEYHFTAALGTIAEKRD